MSDAKLESSMIGGESLGWWAAVQARMRRYRATEGPNLSKRVIDEYFESKGRNPQQRQSMHTICKRPAVTAVFLTAHQ